MNHLFRRSGVGEYLFWVLSAAVFFLVGCTANRAYRDRDSRPWRHNPQQDFVAGEQLPQYEPFEAAESARHHFDFSYIEFDEKGDYWDRRQLAWTIDEIRRVARRQNVVLVVYVHGWQNDASDLRGHDVAKIHCLLERLSATQHDRRFFGVYIGWRGKSVPGGDGWFKKNSIADVLSRGTFFVPHELSFYGRKNAATRVAGLPVTESIFETVRAARTGTKASGHLARTILVGHSFGALLLEKAMAQAFAAELVMGESGQDGKFTAPADLVVLLNSAGESIYAKEMQDFLRRRYGAHGHGADEVSAIHPLIVSVTSTADGATGGLFPIGTGLSNLGGGFREYQWDQKYGDSSHDVNQKEYFTTTSGHNRHIINYIADPQGRPELPRLEDQDGCDPNMLTAFQDNLTLPLSGPGGQVEFDTLNQNGARVKWRLRATLPESLRTPYWVIQVPKEIMRSHTDIFNENSLALLARLFRVSNPDSGPGIKMSAVPRTMRLTSPEEQVKEH